MRRWDYNNQEFVSEEPTFDLKKVWQKILDNIILIIVCVLVALILAFMVNRNTTPAYEVVSSALIKSPNEAGGIADLLYGQEFFGRSSTNLENEAYLFQSYNLIDRTLRELNFNISYYYKDKVRDVELYDRSPIKLTFEGIALTIPIKCTIIDDQTYRLNPVSTGFMDKLFSYISKNEDPEIDFNDQVFEFGKFYQVQEFKFKIEYYKYRNNDSYRNEIVFQTHEYSDLTGQYQKMLNVNPLSLESSILTISINVNDKKKGMTFLDKLVEKYIADELQQKNEMASKTIDFINNQILLMSDSLNVVENRLEKFKQSNTDLNLSNEGIDFMESSQLYQRELAELQLKNQYLNDLRSIIQTNEIDQIIVPSSVGIDDPNLNKTIQDLVDLQLQVRITEVQSINNPIVRSYKQRIDALKSTIVDGIGSVKASNETAIRSLNQRIGRVSASLRSLPTAEREFINIQRNYNLSEELYLFLMEKKAEAGIAKASNTVDYRVIDSARVTKKTAPRSMLNYAFAMVMGFMSPIVFIFLIDTLNNKITSKEDLSRLTTIPFLGMIAKNNGKSHLIYNGKVKSEVVESFRTLRSNLRYMIGDNSKGKTFLLTSYISAEGKSFCSNNLAYIFSNFGKKVVLINADMRKVNQYQELGLDDSIGLSDYLVGIATIDQVVRQTRFPNFSVITSGGVPPNPSELLISGKFDNLLTELKATFDYIIIDTPPIGILADGLELMSKTDANIIVVRQNYTHRKMLEEIEELYQKGEIKNLALIFNDVNFKKSKYGYDYNYYDKMNKKPSIKYH